MTEKRCSDCGLKQWGSSRHAPDCPLADERVATIVAQLEATINARFTEDEVSDALFEVQQRQVRSDVDTNHARQLRAIAIIAEMKEKRDEEAAVL